MDSPQDDEDDEFIDTIAALGAATDRRDVDAVDALVDTIKKKGWK